MSGNDTVTLRLRMLEDLLLDVSRRTSPLGDRMALFREEHAKLSPAVFQAYDRLVERIEVAMTDISGPAAGDPFPDFLLPDETGTLTRRADILSDGPGVISFNRGHWCHYCRLELRALASAYPSIKSCGATATCIVPERQKFAKRLKSDCNLAFPVLSDIDNSLALELGLVIFVGQELREMYLEIGFDLLQFQGNDSWFLPIPANYLVNQNGIILSRIAKPDFRDRVDPEAMIKMLSRALS